MSHQRLVFLILAMSCLCSAQYHDLFVGRKLEPEILLEQQQIKVPGLAGRQVEEFVTLGGNGLNPITRLRAYDQDPSGRGANASIVYGGIGNTFVTLKFVSQPGHAIHFLVDIYGQWR